MKRNIYNIFAILLILSVFIMSSCERTADISGGSEIDSATGEPVTVNFMVSESGMDAGWVDTRASSPNPSVGAGFARPSGVREGLETAVVRIADDLYMYATLQKEAAPVKLHAAQLITDTKVRVVVYSGASYTDHADYVTLANGVLQPIGTPLTVPAGSYRFVAYSFHDVGVLDPYADTTAIFSAKDVLWGDAIETITPASPVHINLSHLFSKVKMVAALDAGVGLAIYNITGASVSSYEPALVVETGELVLDPPAASMGTVPLWSTSVGATPWISDDQFVFTAGECPFIEFSSVTIDGITHSGSYRVDYTSLALEGGKEYTLYVRFVKNANVSPSVISLTGSSYTPTLQPGEIVTVTSAASWTLISNEPWLQLTLNPNGSDAGASVSGSGNATVYLVVEGNASTTQGRTAYISQGGTQKVTVNQGVYVAGGFSERITWDGGTGTYVLTDNYTDAGLFFRFGSVVGIFSGTGGQNQTLPLLMNSSSGNFDPAVDVAWSPVAIGGAIGAVAWGNVPAVNTHPTTINSTFHTIANVKAGLGDPCRLVGLDLDYIKNTPAGLLTTDDIDNGLWMLPTPTDNTAFTIGSTNTGSWWDGSSSNPFGLVIGAEYPSRNSLSGLPNQSKFLPAGGFRNFGSIGDRGYFGVWGRYWGNATTSVTMANAIGFNSTSNTHTGSYGITLGINIRCVRQLP